jgi:hypothetical protein
MYVEEGYSYRRIWINAGGGDDELEDMDDSSSFNIQINF